MASLVEIEGMPFDAEEIEEGGSIKYDRVYLAKNFAAYFAQFVGNGVYAEPAKGLYCLWAGGLSVSVNPGHCFVNGYHGYIKKPVILSVSAGNPTNPRIDRIVARLNLLERRWELAVSEGTPSNSPVPPPLKRYTEESGNYYELGLATVRMEAGASVIANSAAIKDTRLDVEVCGLVTGLIEQIDLTDLYLQYDNFLQEKIASWNKQQADEQTKWQNQTAKQQTDFTKQINTQQQQFNTLKTGIEGWYEGVKADISKLQNFDFDNIANLDGASRSTDFIGDTQVNEEIKIKKTGRLVAKRVSNFLPDGDIKEEIFVYKEDGVNVLSKSTNNIAFDWDGHDVLEDVSFKKF